MHVCTHTYIFLVCPLRRPRKTDTSVGVNTPRTQILVSKYRFAQKGTRNPWRNDLFHLRENTTWDWNIFLVIKEGSGQGMIGTCQKDTGEVLFPLMVETLKWTNPPKVTIVHSGQNIWNSYLKWLETDHKQADSGGELKLEGKDQQ